MRIIKAQRGKRKQDQKEFREVAHMFFKSKKEKNQKKSKNKQRK